METQTEIKQTAYSAPGITPLKPVTSEAILKEVCDYFFLDYDIAKSKIQKIKYVRARQIAHYFARYYKTEKSLWEIGSIIGEKDHATVLYSIKMVENDMKNYRKIKEQVEQIKAIIEKNYIT
ncbi:MAG: helix-turn-helix domain-containing protein [Bacteroidota bacterium]